MNLQRWKSAHYTAGCFHYQYWQSFNISVSLWEVCKTMPTFLCNVILHLLLAALFCTQSKASQSLLKDCCVLYPWKSMLIYSFHRFLSERKLMFLFRQFSFWQWWLKHISAWENQLSSLKGMNCFWSVINFYEPFSSLKGLFFYL